jgi:hypothetical protein
MVGKWRMHGLEDADSSGLARFRNATAASLSAATIASPCLTPINASISRCSDSCAALLH